ncbi:MAG TPA: ParB N-terminal domain-containing protein [candidate division Zixibacteria bacterium]
MRLHVNDIQLDPQLERRERVEGISKQNDEFLMKSIKNEGLTDHLVVQKVKGEQNKWRLIKGYRRLRALVALDKLGGLPSSTSLSSLPVIEIKDDVNPATLRVESHRWEDFLPSEKAQRLEELQRKFDMSLKEIANMYGWSTPSVRNWLIINKALPEIKEAIDKGKYPMSAGKVFGTMNEKGQRYLHSKFGDQDNVKRAELWHEWRKIAAKDHLFTLPKKKRVKISQRLVETKPGSKHKHRLIISKEKREKEILNQNIALIQRQNLLFTRDRDDLEKKVFEPLRIVEIWFREDRVREYVKKKYPEIYDGLKAYIGLILNIKIND